MKKQEMKRRERNTITRQQTIQLTDLMSTLPPLIITAAIISGLFNFTAQCNAVYT